MEREIVGYEFRESEREVGVYRFKEREIMG